MVAVEGVGFVGVVVVFVGCLAPDAVFEIAASTSCNCFFTCTLPGSNSIAFDRS